MISWIKLNDKKPRHKQIIVVANGNFSPSTEGFFRGSPYFTSIICYGAKEKKFYEAHNAKEEVFWFDSYVLIHKLHLINQPERLSEKTSKDDAIV